MDVGLPPPARPDGGLRRPVDPRGARDHRRRRPDHRAATPRPRRDDARPEAVPRLQRQHQPRELRAALFGGDVELRAPGRTRDFGLGWESAAALRAVADYGPELVVALDVDFGHTSPQLVLPHGGRVTVDGARQRIIANFG